MKKRFLNLLAPFLPLLLPAAEPVFTFRSTVQAM